MGDMSEMAWRAVQRAMKTPGDHFTEYPMTSTARRLLVAQRGRHPKFVWTYEVERRHGRHRRGDRRPLTKTVIRQQLGAVLKDLMGKFRVHDLRHTAARRTLRKTKNLRAVQRVLGHSDVTTTAINLKCPLSTFGIKLEAKLQLLRAS